MTGVRNTWYVAGWSRQFDREIRRVTILDRHIAMYRVAFDEDKVILEAIEAPSPDRLRRPLSPTGRENEFPLSRREREGPGPNRIHS